jgi:hypothetical protein
MSGFSDARAIEAKAMAVLVPFLTERAHDGRLVLCNKGPLAKRLQETTGDAIFNSDPDTMWTVEIKAERTFTGNLFLETWSNRNLEDRYRHAERGSNRGWMDKLVADLLLYYFLDVDRLYIINLFKLKQWAFGGGDGVGRIYSFPEKKQGRYSQLNDTWGRIVPIATIEREVRNVRLVYPKQIELFQDEVAA